MQSRFSGGGGGLAAGSQNNSNATAPCWRGPVGTRGFPTATSACATRSPPTLQQAGCAPPSLEELAAALGEPPPRIAAMARLLAERGVVARLDDQIWMHRDAVEAGKQSALKLFARAPAFTTMEFRDALGVSRKFAVPLVDYLDKIRFTVRSGNNRTPGAEAKKLLDMKIDFAKRRRVMERSQRLGHCICDVRRPCPCDVLREQNLCPCAGERPDRWILRR